MILSFSQTGFAMGGPVEEGLIKYHVAKLPKNVVNKSSKLPIAHTSTHHITRGPWPPPYLYATVIDTFLIR